MKTFFANGFRPANGFQGGRLGGPFGIPNFPPNLPSIPNIPGLPAAPASPPPAAPPAPPAPAPEPAPPTVDLFQPPPVLPPPQAAYAVTTALAACPDGTGKWNIIDVATKQVQARGVSYADAPAGTTFVNPDVEPICAAILPVTAPMPAQSPAPAAESVPVYVWVGGAALALVAIIAIASSGGKS